MQKDSTETRKQLKQYLCPMDFLWIYNRFGMDFQWICNGFAMDLQWFFNGFSIDFE